MSVTVKDFLRHNPNAMLDLMTPKGLIQLTPDRGQWLLTKNGANARIKVTGTQEVVVGSDLLCQIVYKIVPYRNRRNQIFLLTNTPAAAAKSSFRPHIEYEQMTFDLYHRRKSRLKVSIQLYLNTYPENIEMSKDASEVYSIYL